MRILNNTRLRKSVSGQLRSLKLIKEMNRNKNSRVFMFCTPLSNNLGDHAITLAQKIFFKTYFKDKNICEIPRLFTDILIKTVKRNVTPSDLIVINGGGFMGDVWFAEETMMRKVILEFPNNNIIVFPQTIHYSKTENGKVEFENSKKIYASHKNLYLFARDRISYDTMREAYQNCQIFLCPDIVLFGGFNTKSDRRSKILLCLREDKESKLDNVYKKKIKLKLSSLHEKVIKVDTVIDRYLAIDEREKYVNEKLNEFANSKLVITDRLHGMVFCALTGTPCIVFDNNNHKIKGVYEWIKDLPYLYYIKNLNELNVIAKKLMNMEEQHYDDRFLRDEYKPLIDLIGKL